MRNHLASWLIALCVSLATLTPARAAEEQTWSGYIWTNSNGELQMGSAIIAMSTIGYQKDVIAKDLARNLKPLISDVSGSVIFWNYDWLEDPAGKLPAADVKKLPKTLVRLRGKVTSRAVLEGKPEIGDSDPFSRDVVMTEGRLVSAEHLSETWLKDWQKLARLGLRYGYLEGDPPAARVKEVAPRCSNW
jgi:hypothetical protein